MTSKIKANSNSNLKNSGSTTIQLGGEINNISNRPLSSRQLTQRPPHSSRPDSAIKPVKHEPCSSTLAKFHDSVNNSLMYDNIGSSRKNSIPHPPPHPIIEAKNKYKYMTKQKSYVDETLFGGQGGNLATPSSNYNSNFNYDYNYVVNQNYNNHLTHNLMSNMTPLIINSRPRSSSANYLNSGQPKSARPQSARQEHHLDQDNLKNNYQLSKLAYQKPWKP